MTSGKPLHLSIVVGRSSHPEVVIDDLWNRAVGAWGQHAGKITGTAVYAYDGDPTVTVGDNRLTVVPLTQPSGGPVASLLTAAAGKPGPIGVTGRLIRDNLESRRLARTLGRRTDLQEIFRASDVVVAADLTADRSVWELRKHTGAGLVHGPIAMLHVLRHLARK